MSQIKAVLIEPDQVKIYIRQNNFFAGIINLEKRIFYHVPRSSKNLFHLFGEPSLGVNEEILLRKDFDVIKIKFNDDILSTFRMKWLNEGITSPYCSANVDKQIVLSLDKINLDYAQQNEQQPDLFNKAM